MKDNTTTKTPPQTMTFLTATKPTLLTLPKEIRMEILRNLISIPPAPRPKTNSWLSRCYNCADVAKVREERRGYSHFHRTVALVCRQLRDESKEVIAENQFVGIQSPHRVNYQVPSDHQVGFWIFPNCMRTPAKPVMSFTIEHDEPFVDATAPDVFLFDLRDLGTVVRLLLSYCSSFTQGRAVDVSIGKLSVFQKSFLGMVWPWLNGEIGSITLEPLNGCISLRRELPQIIDLATNIPLANVPGAVEAFLNNIQADKIAYAPGTSLRWDMRPAKKIYQKSMTDLFNLSRSGCWTSRTHWQEVEHEVRHNLEDQLHYLSELPGRLCPEGYEATKEFLRSELSKLNFVTAAIYMTLAYREYKMPAQKSLRCAPVDTRFALRLPGQNYLHRTPRELWWQARRHSDHIYWDSLDQGSRLYYDFLGIEDDAVTYDPYEDGSWGFILVVLDEAGPVDAEPGWSDAQVHQGLQAEKEYIESAGNNVEDARARWESDPAFRARFFRGYCKSQLVPFVIARFGPEEGKFYRDALPEDVDEWLRVYSQSMGDESAFMAQWQVQDAPVGSFLPSDFHGW